INRPRRELYDFWRDFANLPRFMENLRDVSDLGDGRSSWRVAGPAGSEVELVSEIREDVPGERIAWTSTEASDIDHEGWVAFRD
ncbi:SRPBCC family protein, partial [Klebsiella pneumoniae]|uniref:SRPBCC family protein n=1 Tax=Klebsiella pneumoniae TaxID=573 RepID=UPI0022B9F82C